MRQPPLGMLTCLKQTDQLLCVSSLSFTRLSHSRCLSYSFLTRHFITSIHPRLPFPFSCYHDHAVTLVFLLKESKIMTHSISRSGSKRLLRLNSASRGSPESDQLPWRFLLGRNRCLKFVQTCPLKHTVMKNCFTDRAKRCLHYLCVWLEMINVVCLYSLTTSLSPFLRWLTWSPKQSWTLTKGCNQNQTQIKEKGERSVLLFSPKKRLIDPVDVCNMTFCHACFFSRDEIKANSRLSDPESILHEDRN